MGGVGGCYIDGFWRRDSRMRNRCVFGCGGSDGLVGGKGGVSFGFRGACVYVRLGDYGWERWGFGDGEWEGRRGGDFVPQRLQRVWVLLWRLPKDEVPFAVGIDQLMSLEFMFALH